jgi:hypothetical protein
MEKRLFQVLDEMNVLDGVNKTANVALCSSLISMDQVKAGVKVTMGVPHGSINILDTSDKIIMLLVVDRKEYDRLKVNP